MWLQEQGQDLAPARARGLHCFPGQRRAIFTCARKRGGQRGGEWWSVDVFLVGRFPRQLLFVVVPSGKVLRAAGCAIWPARRAVAWLLRADRAGQRVSVKGASWCFGVGLGGVSAPVGSVNGGESFRTGRMRKGASIRPGAPGEGHRFVWGTSGIPTCRGRRPG